MNPNPPSPGGCHAPSSKQSSSLSSTHSLERRQRIEEQRDLDEWASFEYPPEYWDGLSAIRFSAWSLRELDRRAQIALREASPPPPIPVDNIERFARGGGPDLSDIIGYAPEVSSSILLQESIYPPTDEPSTRASDELVIPYKMRNLTPYDRNFGQHLTDFNVDHFSASEQLDTDELLEELLAPHASISLSDFSAADFAALLRSDGSAEDETTVINNIVIPLILGPITDDCAFSVLFKNLDSLTNGTIAKNKPDVYYGTIANELHRNVRDELGGHLVPSASRSRPIVPNFILEVKGSFGSFGVAELQTRYGGALGCRAMHSLQNYGKDQPVYDGKPRTFTATYASGMLTIFAHHMTAPVVDGGRPRYHMTRVGIWALISNRRQFVEGVTAFRNARDLAKRYRDRFIAEANAVVARESGSVPNSTAISVEEQEDGDDTSMGGMA